MKDNFVKMAAIWLGVMMAALVIFNQCSRKGDEGKPVSYSEFVRLLDGGKLKSAEVSGYDVSGVTAGGKVHTTIPYDAKLTEQMLAKNVEVTSLSTRGQNLGWSFASALLPTFIIIGFFWYFAKMQAGSSNRLGGFGKTRAKLLTEVKGTVTFGDVAGAEEAKEELQEVVEFLKDAKRFTRLGGKIPKGVLLVGPPGTGKTLLARAVAGEAGVPFFSLSGSDFVEMFVGVGASRVRDLFAQGKKHAPCIIFIDEIDAVGRHRGAGLGGGHDEREQTLNQLLVEMDGFEANEGVILIAATNRPDVLDPALLRPGRFDRQVVVGNPDVRGREEILKVHCRNVPLAADVLLEQVARATPGFSGAELANLVNEAALVAARRSGDSVAMADFESARDKVIMGAERRSLVISDKEKTSTAYHEAGHALVALLVDGADPLHKVSIIPRGRALGVTVQVPDEDRHSHSREGLLVKIRLLMGGRAAEELVLGHFTTGAGNDIERATELARRMICEWGMSDVFGPVSFGRQSGSPFLGRELASHREFSEETSRRVDGEIMQIVNGCYRDVLDLLAKNRAKLEAVARELIARETISGDEAARAAGIEVAR